MKVLLILFLAGFVLSAASPLYELDQVGDFGEFVDDIDYFYDDKPTLDEVKEKLKKKFNNFLQKVRDALKGGKDIKDEILKKGKEIKEKFKLLKEQLDKDGKDFFEKPVEHGRNYLKQVFEKFEVNDKRPIDYHVEAIMQTEGTYDVIQKLKDRFQEVKKVAIEKGKSLKNGLETIKEKFHLEQVKAFIEKHVGENQELVDALTQFMNDNGKIRDFIKKIVDAMIQVHNVSSSNVFEEIRDFFKDLGVEIRNRFAKFGEWVKEQYRKGLEKSKDRLENIKNIAKEFLEDSRKISRDAAEEALKFFREYKNDLGIIFDDIEVKVKDILKQD